MHRKTLLIFGNKTCRSLRTNILFVLNNIRAIMFKNIWLLSLAITIVSIALILYLFYSANLGIITDSWYKLQRMYHLPKKYVIPFLAITQSNYQRIVPKLTYPIIFKPNMCNDSGDGVEKIDNESQAYDYLAKAF